MRFFHDDSIWNRPIGPSPAVDPSSDRLIRLLGDALPTNRRGFWINTDYWTIPVYEVDAHTPLRPVYQRPRRPGEKYQPPDAFRHGPGFGPLVPIPDSAQPAREADQHLAIVDRERQLAWDMWAARKREDGEWESFTGMVYPINGPGTFDAADFPIRDGDSLHSYGPSRHAGVPAIAGLVMYDEILSGWIDHKLSFATCVNAYKRFVWPAIWSDGSSDDGIPEGATIQLDPGLDLARFNLSPAARTIARALQEYGMINVDSGGGAAVYVEGLWGQRDRSWDGLLADTDLLAIPIDRYRVLELGPVTHKGFDTRKRRFAK